jgi:uncharacterized protein (TIGR02145 family)
MDARDGKKYEIRKFPDGKCWMVDNLAYGGTTEANGSTDYCAGKTSALTYGSSSSYGSANPNWFIGNNNLYGDCRDPAIGSAYAPCQNHQCGYYYNWQAAMQAAGAYSGISFVPTLPHQGICPQGWHLPSGYSGEFAALISIVGGSWAASTNYQTTFWQPSSTNAISSTDPWKCVLVGHCYNTGEFIDQAVGSWWSTTDENGASANWMLGTHQTNSNPPYYYKNYGLSVRCIKD